MRSGFLDRIAVLLPPTACGCNELFRAAILALSNPIPSLKVARSDEVRK
jgi:hypothetical protein